MEAGAADLVLVDEGDLEAQLGGAEGGRVATGARAEDDEVEVVGGADGHRSGVLRLVTGRAARAAARVGGRASDRSYTAGPAMTRGRSRPRRRGLAAGHRAPAPCRRARVPGRPRRRPESRSRAAISQPGFCDAGASAAALGAEAVRAIDRLAVGRTERDLGFLAAARAGRGEHLAGPAAAAAVATAAAARAAARAAGGIAAPTAVPGVIAAARVRAAAVPAVRPSALPCGSRGTRGTGGAPRIPSRRRRPVLAP